MASPPFNSILVISLSSISYKVAFIFPEISIQASKGHYINVGDMVQLNVQESILLGSHRITSKKIQVKSGGVDLSFTLNKEPIKLSEYIDIGI